MAQEPEHRDQPNYLRAAFQWQYNLIALGGAAVFSVISQSPLPLMLASGCELMYLATVPNMPRFQRLVRSWTSNEKKQASEDSMRALHNDLSPELRDRYRRMQAMVSEIRNNYQRLSSTSMIFIDQINTKLDGLVHSYLRLANAWENYEEHLKKSNPRSVAFEADQLKRSIVNQPQKVQEVNRKRLEILQKRLERFQNISDDVQVLAAQCRTIEDVLDLIRDQSITLTDPEQVSSRLESLLTDVQTTEDSVREMESFFSDTIPIAGAGPMLDDPNATRGNKQRHGN